MKYTIGQKVRFKEADELPNNSKIPFTHETYKDRFAGKTCIVDAICDENGEITLCLDAFPGVYFDTKYFVTD